MPVPAAEYLVGRLRAEFDDAAALGVPAHVTVIYPFVPPARITPQVIGELAAMFSAVPPFDVTFARVSWFGDQVLWLAPTPAEPFRQLTAAVWERFPDHPPYRGAHAEVVPHLTIGHSHPVERLRAVAGTVESGLPISTRAEEVLLLQGGTEAGSWHSVAQFRLAAAPGYKEINE